jgi:hypothetical protein
MRMVRLMCCAAAMLMIAGVARADEFNKLTVVTFSAPVEIPGKTLPAGTYRLQLADPESGRRVIRISDQAGKKNYGMFLTMENQRLRPSDKPIVMFAEAPAGSPHAVRAWFYPGETYGYEFVYPHSQAMKIAKATHAPVLSSAADRPAADDSVASMKATAVTRIDETGNVSSDEALKDSAPPLPAPVATSGNASAASPAPAASAAPEPARAPRRHLPQTASGLPLMMLLSGLMLAGGFAIRLLRQHAA